MSYLTGRVSTDSDEAGREIGSVPTRPKNGEIQGEAPNVIGDETKIEDIDKNTFEKHSDIVFWIISKAYAMIS